MQELRNGKTPQTKSKKDAVPWFQQIFGTFNDDPEFDDMIRAGKAIRDSDCGFQRIHGGSRPAKRDDKCPTFWIRIMCRFCYKRLDRVRLNFERMNVLPFDEAAQTIFGPLRRQCSTVGVLDLRIASITLASGSILLTRNFRDFEHVPGLLFED